jgi:hypothetical protein
MNWRVASGVAGALLLFGSRAALADNVSASGSQQAASVGTSPSTVLAARNRGMLVLDNESATATIACAFGATPALNTAGSWTLPPGTTRSWAGPLVPNEALECISSASATPLTIQIWNTGSH